MKKVVGLLDGMYAIAVTDGNSVVVARDPVGKKPVYYLENGGITYFSSEGPVERKGHAHPSLSW